MVQRVQLVALAASLAIGAAVVAGLTLGSRDAPVRVGPTAMSANDQVEIYAAILVHLAPPGPGTGSTRAIRVSRTIHDTCMPRQADERGVGPMASGAHDSNPPPASKNVPPACGHATVGRLKPDIEAALHEALARQGLEAAFGEEGEFSLHQIVTEAAGTPAADADDGHRDTKFHFKRIGGLWKLQGTTVEWTVE
jgi:hypothetical protein